nr:PA2778 family cysteine peptidase [Thioalkalivibrio paradoxus]
MPVWLLFAALVAGCASAPQSARIQQEARADLPARAELTTTPFFPQREYQCGPAALATVLAVQDIDVLPDDLISEVYVPERQGSLQAEMRAAARARGLVAYRLRPELDDLLAEVAAGQPVVVFQNLGLGFAPRWHYAVVVGYDLDAGQIVLRSGTIERHLNSLPRFERTWARGGHWAFVAVPPDRPPASAEPLQWLRAVNELEQTGLLEAARTGYETAVRHWPWQPIGYIGLANTRFAAGDFPEAEDALHALLQTQPERHEAWNNLAHVLVARECGPLAREAAACASRLAPQPGIYQRTVHMAADATASATECRPLPPCPADAGAAAGEVRR